MSFSHKEKRLICKQCKSTCIVFSCKYHVQHCLHYIGLMFSATIPFYPRALPSSHWPISHTNNIIISFSRLSPLHCRGIHPSYFFYQNFLLKPLADFLYQHHYIIIIIVSNRSLWHGFLSSISFIN